MFKLLMCEKLTILRPLRELLAPRCAAPLVVALLAGGLELDEASVAEVLGVSGTASGPLLNR